ncbi:MAG: Brp/Blh family beta-carotene 15,15'-dioxygenase [Flavobacteriales bacterium]|nr:Brp/Blh family beta-carotene 15,15'-dioxygenase [Flavobacteriales bacterium]
MMRTWLLLFGAALLIGQQGLRVFTPEVQVGLFFLGVVLVGVPHGAADLLVSTQQARDAGRMFHTPKFLLGYVGRLLVFAAVLYFLPVLGSALFILFSAYHFGETDLAKLRTETLWGKFVVLNYGLVILGIILLGHAEEVEPILAVLEASPQQALWLEWVISSKLLLLGTSMVLFFGSAFAYFVLNPSSHAGGGDFIARFAMLALLLHFLPLVLGFTFYFIVWHSVLSLSNILSYLRKDGLFSTQVILGRVVFYSILALVGMALLAACGFVYLSTEALMISVIAGLAVLTAPHMGVMHEMYGRLRSQQSQGL